MSMKPERLAEIHHRSPVLAMSEDEQDAAALLAEVYRLRAGIEALIRTGYDHTPDCRRERALGWLAFHPDCGRCWENSLHALLNPEETS